MTLEGPLFLTAGPGSGKTRVLLWRTLNLIVFHNVQPNEIFLATFTEKAALQLKEGLQGLLSIASKYTHKPYDIAEMYVGTLHSLCQKLLSDRRFSEGMARSRRPVIMDELDQHFFIARSDNWNALLEAGGFDPAKAVDAYYQINTSIKLTHFFLLKTGIYQHGRTPPQQAATGRAFQGSGFRLRTCSACFRFRSPLQSLARE